MLVNTNACFLEEDYMIDNKPRSKIILDELRAEVSEGSEVPVSVPQVREPRVVSTQDRGSLVVVGGLLDNQNISLV